jgi:Fur family ferric uptake transcriptional regulator
MTYIGGNVAPGLWRSLPLSCRGEPMAEKMTRLEELCLAKGLKMTGQRRVIARVLSESTDHPDVEQLHRRAAAIDSRISLATVYRTVRLLEETQILARHDFGDGRARYEQATADHHDHLIDLESRRVIEFKNEAIERLQREAARALGFELVGHRLELYGVPIRAPSAAPIAASDPGTDAPSRPKGGK